MNGWTRRSSGYGAEVEALRGLPGAEAAGLRGRSILSLAALPRIAITKAQRGRERTERRCHSRNPPLLLGCGPDWSGPGTLGASWRPAGPGELAVQGCGPGRMGPQTIRIEAGRGGDRHRGVVSVVPARPLVRPAPRSAMFFPLVVLVAVLPGLYALNSWDLTPPGPWWGLRGLAVLDGLVARPGAGRRRRSWRRPEARAFRAVAFQPPLYAWLEAVGLALSPTATRWRPSCRATWPGRWWWSSSTSTAGSGAGRGWADRGGAHRVQPQPAGPDAAGDADDPGPGRAAGGPALLRRGTCGVGRRRRAAAGPGRPGGARLARGCR